MEQKHPDVPWSDVVKSRLRNTLQRLQSLNTVIPAIGARNVNDLFRNELTTGDRIAVCVARGIGSWGFVIGQTVFLSAWAVLNMVARVKGWDPYPFILMSLILTIQAAFTAPLIMMAQNREVEKDRLMLQEDFETNRRAEEEIERIRHILEQHGHLLGMLLEERWHTPEEKSRDDESGPSGPPTTTTEA